MSREKDLSTTCTRLLPLSSPFFGPPRKAPRTLRELAEGGGRGAVSFTQVAPGHRCHAYRIPIGMLSDAYRTPIGMLSDAYRMPIGCPSAGYRSDAYLSDAYRIPIGMLSDAHYRMPTGMRRINLGAGSPCRIPSGYPLHAYRRPISQVPIDIYLHQMPIASGKRIPIGYLSDTHRIPIGCPLGTYRVPIPIA